MKVEIVFIEKGNWPLSISQAFAKLRGITIAEYLEESERRKARKVNRARATQ